MQADGGSGASGGKRRPLTMGELAANYSPQRTGDMLFLHGLARIAARRALRADKPLYVPPEWARERGDGDA